MPPSISPMFSQYLEFILCSYYIIRSTSDDHQFAWELLSVIASGENMDLRRYLSRVMEHWSKAKKLTPALVKALCSHTEDKDHLQVRQMSWMDGSIQIIYKNNLNFDTEVMEPCPNFKS